MMTETPDFRILLYRDIFFYSSKIDLNYFDNLSETILLTSIVTLQDDNLLIPREKDPERENSLENTFRKGKKGPSSFYRQEILLSEFFKLRPNVFH